MGRRASEEVVASWGSLHFILYTFTPFKSFTIGMLLYITYAIKCKNKMKENHLYLTLPNVSICTPRTHFYLLAHGLHLNQVLDFYMCPSTF